MNVKELRKNIGKLYRLRPKAWLFDSDGKPLRELDDSWRLEAVATSPTQLRLVNLSTNHVAELEADNIIERRSPDFLLLRCQLLLRPSRVDIEPMFRGSPVLPDRPQVVVVPPPEDPASDNRASIVWDFERVANSQQMSDALFGFGCGTAGFWVTYFRISGKNVSSKPIEEVSAEVRPQMLQESVPLQFEIGANERVDTAGYIIEAGASFVLAAAIPSPPHEHGSHGYIVEHYLRRIGGFEFVFRGRGVTYSRSFSFADVKEMVEGAEKRYGPQLPQPRVRRIK